VNPTTEDGTLPAVKVPETQGQLSLASGTIDLS